MALANVDAPEYNEKVEYILKELEKGRSREDVAGDYDYSNYKSLDIYLRRKGFRYDSKKENYIPDLPEPEIEIPKSAGSKETLIISLFSQDELEPQRIAKRAGFSDHREMAKYMQKKSYKWDSSKGNYRYYEDDSADGENVEEDSSDDSIDLNHGLESDSNDLLKYISLLQKLKEKEEELFRLLDRKSDGTLPKYAIPGESMTKSIYMGRRLVQLVEEFSSLKNVSQREIVEAALVDYLRNHGFSTEVDALFKI